MQVTLSRVSGWISPTTKPCDEATKMTLYSLPRDTKTFFTRASRAAGKLVDLVEQLDFLFQGNVVDRRLDRDRGHAPRRAAAPTGTGAWDGRFCAM